jgi:hypothetical protein
MSAGMAAAVSMSVPAPGLYPSTGRCSSGLTGKTRLRGRSSGIASNKTGTDRKEQATQVRTFSWFSPDRRFLGGYLLGVRNASSNLWSVMEEKLWSEPLRLDIRPYPSNQTMSSLKPWKGKFLKFTLIPPL